MEIRCDEDGRGVPRVLVDPIFDIHLQGDNETVFFDV
jgi:hypothetical protein